MAEDQGVEPYTDASASASPAADVARGDRPSRHGAALGKVLAWFAEGGRKHAPELPPMCGTCAFREGSLPNQTAGTGLLALNCVLRIDKDRFACHHGMSDGEPTKICAGYIAAMLAPFPLVKAAIGALSADLALHGRPDDVRAAYDAWADEVDSDNQLDVYQLARLYATSAAGQSINRQAQDGSSPSIDASQPVVEG